MSAFKAGDLVRHRSKPEWGIGRVTGQTVEGKVLVKFSARAGDVLLTAAGAAQHLVADDGASWQSTPTTLRRAATVGRVPCSTCAEDVRAPITRAEGSWRACPECSAQNGKQHVLRPYPDAFDESVASAPAADLPAAAARAASDPVPAGRDQWCLNCRSNGRVAVGASRVCAEFAR
ncbi:MAG: DUF3553 domain-containing protein [Vicinamibacterales bacterium]